MKYLPLEEYKAKWEAEFNKIDWSNIDFGKKTRVQNILKVINNYYWGCCGRRGKSEPILPNTDIFNFVYNAFKRWHNSWDKKTRNKSVTSFYIAKSKGNDTQCFHFTLDSDTPEDNSISYGNRAFMPYEKALRLDINEACRNTIALYKEEFKKQKIGTYCPITGQILTSDNSVVHHDVISMDEIIDGWINLQGDIFILSQFINNAADGGDNTEFTNNAIKKSFFDYHKEKAVLLVVTEEGHKLIHAKK